MRVTAKIRWVFPKIYVIKPAQRHHGRGRYDDFDTDVQQKWLFLRGDEWVWKK